MIVLDVGCARYGGDYSIERLIEEFKPDIVYGFDPNQGLDEYPWGVQTSALPCSVVIAKVAAWIYDGEIGFLSDGLNSCLTDRTDVPMVPCFDLANFIFDVAIAKKPIVLKMDAEGSEYELLDHLIATGADKFLELAWIEWHPKRIPNAEQRRRAIEEHISCEVTEWRW